MKNRIDNYIKRSSYFKENGDPLIWNSILVFLNLIVVTFVLWAFFTKVDEVTYAPGKIITRNNILKIQHIDGGEVEEVLVSDGVLVEEGEPLIILRKDVLTLKFNQKNELYKGATKKRDILSQQLEIRKKLYDEGLNSKITYLNIASQLNDVETEIRQLKSDLDLLESKINSSVIVSSMKGVIHNLLYKNKGEIIAKGETILEIYPLDFGYEAELKISPDDIGHVKEGLKVTVKFNTFDFSRYGGIVGTLDRLSKTTFLDKEGVPYYKGIVSLNDKSFERDGVAILPGMTVGGEIKTGDKSIFQYLLKPIYYTKSKALTER